MGAAIDGWLFSSPGSCLPCGTLLLLLRIRGKGHALSPLSLHPTDAILLLDDQRRVRRTISSTSSTSERRWSMRETVKSTQSHHFGHSVKYSSRKKQLDRMAPTFWQAATLLNNSSEAMAAR
eukprot:scaffold29369_cov57-Cyclotella_meneghiniana.AAC.4